MFLFSISAEGQQRHIILRFIDASDHTAVPFVKVSVIGLKGEPLTQTITDRSGICVYSVGDSQKDSIKVHVRSLGYEEYTSGIISFIEPDSLVREIRLKKNITQLAGVDIFQQHITKEAGKIIYKVNQDQFSASVSGAELFIRLPGVSLVSGMVKVNGRPGTLILIDGKGELKSQEQQLNTLSALGSDLIDKIEIISFPSSRYDASVTSVINVITKKEKGTSSIRADYTQPLFMDEKDWGGKYVSGGAAANLNFKINKIRTSLILGVSNTQRIENTAEKAAFYNMMKYDLLNTSSSASFRITPNLTLDYDINKKTSISLNLDISFMPSYLINTSEKYTFLNYASSQTDSAVIGFNRYRSERRNIQLSGNYKYLLSNRKSSYLFINLLYAGSPSVNANLLSRASGSGDTSTVRNLFKGNTDIVNASLIFTDLIKTPFVTTEAGVKLNILRNHTDQWINNETADFHYSEEIGSLFLSARWKLGGYQLVSELRGELLHSKAAFSQKGAVEELEKQYFKIYPNLILQKNINKDLSISVGYTKKIRRPFASDLNPSLRVSNNFKSQVGNMKFNPAYTGRIEAQLLYKKTSLTLYYESTSNRRVFVPGSNPFISEATNMGRLDRIGILVSHEAGIADRITSSFNIHYAYTKFGDNGMKYYYQHSNLFEISSAHEWTLAKKTRLQVSFYYNASIQLEYSAYSDFFSTSLTLRQILLKDKLTMSVAIADPFGLERTSYRSVFPAQTESAQTVSNNRSFSCRLVYNFPMGAKFRKQSYKVKNDGEVRDQ